MMLTLVRHPATAWSGIRYCGRTDAPLNGEGREQLAAMVTHLSSLTPDRTSVITSPALRCRETAQAIAAALGENVRVDDRLREIDFGDAEGLTFAELEWRWPSLALALLRENARVDWPRGERWSSFAVRVAAAWQDLSAQPGDMIAVTHGGPLRLMLALALPRWPTPVPAHVDPAQVVRLEKEEEWTMRTSWSPASGAAVSS